MRQKSNAELVEENIALRLLLDEARQFSTHAWSCALTLKTAQACSCWYGKTVEALIEPPLLLTVPLEGLECRCGHKTDMHTGRLVGSAGAVCTACNCGCLKFEANAAQSGKKGLS